MHGCSNTNDMTRWSQVKILRSHGADATATNKTKSTPLHVAASFGSPAVVAALLQDTPGSASAVDVRERTPLMLAQLRGHAGVLQVSASSGQIHAPHMTPRCQHVLWCAPASILLGIRCLMSMCPRLWAPQETAHRTKKPPCSCTTLSVASTIREKGRVCT